MGNSSVGVLHQYIFLPFLAVDDRLAHDFAVQICDNRVRGTVVMITKSDEVSVRTREAQAGALTPEKVDEDPKISE